MNSKKELIFTLKQTRIRTYKNNGRNHEEEKKYEHKCWQIFGRKFNYQSHFVPQCHHSLRDGNEAVDSQAYANECYACVCVSSNYTRPSELCI